jgi:GNAT superfamily N-acetyltransferase
VNIVTELSNHTVTSHGIDVRKDCGYYQSWLFDMIHPVYRLPPSQYDRYQQHLLSLDEQSKYTRFGFFIKDDSLIELCDKFKSNPGQHKIFVIEDQNLRVIAAGHIALENNQTELAFSVLKEYRCQGLGSSLMERCIKWCQNRGIRTGCMVCLSTNIAIKKLASKHGVLINDHGETTAEIRIPESNTSSVLHEVFNSSLARVDHMGKLQRNFVKSIAFPLLFKQ